MEPGVTRGTLWLLERMLFVVVALSEIRILRWVGLASKRQVCEFHCIADALKSTYARIVHLRVLKENPVVYLLGSKMKVAPD